MAASTLTSKGQITIPKEVRERLGLKEGDRLVFRFDERGHLLLRPEAQSPLGRLPGLLQHLAKDRPVTIEEMKEAVKRRAVERFKRSVER
jgi:AbrB family looped-hinge helix DNA binding protein